MNFRGIFGMNGGLVSARPTVCLMVISDGIGGAERVVSDLLASLEEGRFSVILIVNSEIYRYFRETHASIRILDLGLVFPRSRVARLLYFRTRRIYDVVKRRILSKMRQVTSFLSENECDLLNSHLMYDLYLAGAIKKGNPNIHLVSTVHSPLGLVPGQRRFVHSRRSFFKMLSVSDAVVCVSPEIEALCRAGLDEFDGEVMVIRNGIDKQRLSTTKAQWESRDIMTLAFCGGDKRVKGGHIFAQALQILYARGLQTPLRVDIMGPVTPGSPWYSQSLKGPASIRVLGMLDPLSLYNNLTAADLLVMPSTTEGHPLLALEALTLGTPVLCSDIPAFEEWIPPELRFALTPEDLAVKLRRFLADSDYRGFARAFAQQFVCEGWASVALRYEELFAKVCDRRTIVSKPCKEL